MKKLNVTHYILGILFITLVFIVAIVYTNRVNENAISIHFADIDGNGKDERITHFYKTSETSLDTLLRIDEKKGIIWINKYEEVLEKSGEPVPGIHKASVGNIVGINNHYEQKIIVVRTSTQGSGGFTGYKIISYKGGKYQVVYEAKGLYHGNVDLWGSGIMERFAYPLPDDSNCCSTYIKYRQINFDKDFKPDIRETVERNFNSYLSPESKDGNTEKDFAERQAESWQPKPYWGEPIDVDNDGKKEKVYYYSTAMTQSPHIAQIVKDDKVIFELEAPRINISEVPDKNGFYLGQYAGLQGTLIARYRFEDGKFIRYEIEYKK